MYFMNKDKIKYEIPYKKITKNEIETLKSSLQDIFIQRIG